jgi:hypothetical protein
MSCLAGHLFFPHVNHTVWNAESVLVIPVSSHSIQSEPLMQANHFSIDFNNKDITAAHNSVHLPLSKPTSLRCISPLILVLRIVSFYTVPTATFSMPFLSELFGSIFDWVVVYGHRFLWFSSDPQGKCGSSTSIRPPSLPSKSFPIHQSSGTYTVGVVK